MKITNMKLKPMISRARLAMGFLNFAFCFFLILLDTGNLTSPKNIMGDDFKAVRLPYGSGKISMYGILPQEDVSISDFIANLDSDRWKVIRDSISEREEVQLRLPRFKLEYGIKNLNDSLTATESAGQILLSIALISKSIATR